MSSKLARSCIAGAFFVAACAMPDASNAADFRLERLTPREMYLARGQSARYVLRIHNVGNTEGAAHIGSDIHDYHHPWLDDFASYTLTQSENPGCGEFGDEWIDFDLYRVVFETAAIAPDSHLDCEMTVVRDATSDHDMEMDWSVRVGEENQLPIYDHAVEAALVGTLTDVSITTRSFQFAIDDEGFAHAIVEVSIYNGGPWPVGPQSAGYCEDHHFRPFVTDGTGPAGCGEDSNGPQCIDWGYGFLMPVVEANDTYRCLVRITSTVPYQQPLSFPIEISRQQGDGVLSLLDVNTDNNRALLRLEPNATNTAPVPSVNYTGLFAGILLTVGLGGWWVRRRVRIQR